MTSEIGEFDARAIRRASNEKVSGWLTVLPIVKHHFDLSAQEFWDGLAIRYKKPLINTPELCDGCGSMFTLSHALSCRKGGLVIQRHNEVRDAISDLASQVWSKVRREPIVRDTDYQSGTSALVADLGVRGVWLPQALVADLGVRGVWLPQALVADLGVRGVWLPQAEALFDVRVIDTDAQ